MSEANETKKTSWWQIGERRARLDELETIAHQQAAKIEALKSQLKDLHQVHQATQQSLIDANEERIVWERRYNQRDQSLQAYKAEQQKWDQEKSQLHHERKQLHEALGEHKNKLAALTQAQDKGQSKTKAMQARVDTLEKELATSTAQAGTLREECDELNKQRAALEEIVKETSEHLQQKRKENKELLAFRENAKANQVDPKAIERELRKRFEAERQKERRVHQLREQQMLWFWRLSAEATNLSCGTSAPLALESAWAACLDEWSAAFGGQAKATTQERLTWLAGVLQHAGLCQELAWKQSGKTYTFSFQPSQLSGQPSMPQTFSPLLHSPIPTLLAALVQATTDHRVALLDCTPKGDKGYSCTLEVYE